MVGIVIVSHSRALGDAVAGLAREMVGGSDAPPLAVAAGLDADTFGTDATAVSAAIEDVAADGNDVLVLVDIGSSVLSAELACELVDPDVAERVKISAAALVEGIVPAVVSAASGAALAEVAAEAAEGLDAKREHLGDAGPVGQAPEDEPVTDHPSVDIVIHDPHGLHARPAAKLVSLVRSYDAAVTVANLDAGTRPVPATSLSKVATLNAAQGARLRVSADGPQAEEVLAAVQALAERGFAPADKESASGAGTRATKPAAGPSHAPGSGLDIAVGPAYVHRLMPDIEHYQAGSPDEERARSVAAVAAVADAIREQQGGDAATDDILDAHLALLDDDVTTAAVADDIAAGAAAPTAWQRALRRVAGDFEALPDDYQRARAQDVRAVEGQLLRALVDGPDSLTAERNTVPAGAVLVVDELDPATAVGLDAGSVAGVVTVRGGTTGHGVLVARSRGIPVFADGGPALAGVDNGTVIGFDVTAGELVVEPSPAEADRLRSRLAREQAAAQEALRHSGEPAVTRDGVRIHVGANLTTEADAQAAAERGAEGAGLVRTEILFGERSSLPSASEQAAQFVAIGRALHGPVTIRTWDVGGDKPLPFLAGPREGNPMLGVRGVRLMQQRSDALDEQLRAVCLAAREIDVQVMFPMVSTRAEVDWALERMAAARAETSARPVPVGIMVEVPAAAIRVGQLARGLDFISIGTNDLTQYTLAADRGNAGVGELADALDPAVLQLIRRAVEGVPSTVRSAVCGDLAGRVEAVPLLVGLGVQELSVAGPMVPRVKQAIRATSRSNARDMAARALAAPSADAVRALLRNGTG